LGLVFLILYRNYFSYFRDEEAISERLSDSPIVIQITHLVKEKRFKFKTVSLHFRKCNLLCKSSFRVTSYVAPESWLSPSVLVSLYEQSCFTLKIFSLTHVAMVSLPSYSYTHPSPSANMF
jgi:hypothetical protein